MVTGLTYLLTSLALVFLLPMMLRGTRNAQGEGISAYAYPRSVRLFFLFMMPVLACLIALALWLSGPGYLLGFSSKGALAAFVLSVFAPLMFAFMYFDRYRVQINEKEIHIKTLFGERSVPFQQVSQIASFRGRGTDLWLYDGRNRVLARFDGSIQGFSEFLHEIEVHTRSSGVTIYKGEALDGWQERENNDAVHWRQSKGPAAIRARNYRVNLIMIVGAVLLATSVAVVKICGL